MKVDKYEKHAWDVQDQVRDKLEDRYREAASGATLTGEIGKRARSELAALEKVMRGKAERILDYEYRQLAGDVFAAMDEHNLSREDRVALVMQLLKPSYTKTELYSEQNQTKIAEHCLQIHYQQPLSTFGHAELKTLINFDKQRLTNAGSTYKECMMDLRKSHSEQNKETKEATQKWVKQKRRADYESSQRGLWEKGHSVGRYWRDKFMGEKMADIDAYNQAHPSSRVVYSNPEMALKEAQAIAVVARRSPEYAKVAFADQIRGIKECAQQDQARSQIVLGRAESGDIRLSDRQREQHRQNIEQWENTLDDLDLSKPTSVPKPQTEPSRKIELPRLDLEKITTGTAVKTKDVEAMKDSFREYYRASKKHQGAARNAFLTDAHSYSTEELKGLLKSAKDYDRASIFRRGLFSGEEREKGLALFAQYQSTIAAEIASRERMIPADDPRLQLDITPHAIAHTFMSDQEGFGSFLQRSEIDRSHVDRILEQSLAWERTAAAEKRQALRSFQEKLRSFQTRLT